MKKLPVSKPELLQNGPDSPPPPQVGPAPALADTTLGTGAQAPLFPHADPLPSAETGAARAENVGTMTRNEKVVAKIATLFDAVEVDPAVMDGAVSWEDYLAGGEDGEA